jgi:hypothetical protein
MDKLRQANYTTIFDSVLFRFFLQLLWQRYLLFTDKKNTLVKGRPNSALATLQQNARAMNILGSSLESRMNLIISNKGSIEEYQDLARVLDLVKKAEMVLNAISDRKESAQYLEEFITIINNVALSMGEVSNDIDDTIVVAGALLSQLHGAISKLSTGALPDSWDEIEPSLFAELSTIVAPGEAHAPRESTVTGASEKKEGGGGGGEEEGGKGQEQAKGVMA